MRRIIKCMFPLFCLGLGMMFFHGKVMAQTEVMAWGNMTGVRVNGQLMEFESSVRVVESGWSRIISTGKERQPRPIYTRDGQSQKVTSNVIGFGFEQIVNDRSEGVVDVVLTYKSDTTRNIEGVYYAFEFPAKRYGKGNVKVGGKTTEISSITELNINTAASSGKTAIIQSADRKIQIDFSTSVRTFLRKEISRELGDVTTLYVQIQSGSLKKGKTGKLTFTMRTTGEIDNAPVDINIDINNPGRVFAGFGGNFRLQNPRVDPQVIDYCLENIRVAWGRVEMPWRNWHPEENSDPIALAKSGKLDDRVAAAMNMAKRLAVKGMPVIVSAWFPPVWAMDEKSRTAGRRGGVAAYKLDPAKTQKVYKSLTDYLVYLKQEYGVEAWAYSFNESDIGIDVLHTAKEHSDFIKGLGAYMASRGLATKVLLGDNSDATTFDFILPAMNDPETHKYIAAVSFHSWRGCDNETLHKWSGAATKLNVPLIVGEGSTDAAAHRYPMIFGESTFALYEINLYTRIAAICQPLSILQWQLTSDYSVLWGAGIFGSEGPLRPTQRFWNLKQLASTPENAFAMPFVCNKEEVNCASFGNKATGQYAVHMVNNGAARTATIKGLPSNTKEIKAYVTNSNDSMKEVKVVKDNNGNLTVELPPISFISVFLTVL